MNQLEQRAPRSGSRRSPVRAGSTWAIVAGGGTAGHVLPALAIGRALVAAGHPADSVHFVGSHRGVEGRLVPDAGFSITLLPGRGLVRRMTAQNAGAVIGLTGAAIQAVDLVARRRPAVILSVGGYASLPCVVAAALLRVPLVVVEQNAVPGAANRVAARVAKVAAVAFDGTDLPRAVVTGNPVPTEVLAVSRDAASRAAARAALGLPLDGVVVAAFGGSLGARRINEAVLALAGAWKDRAGVAIHHVVGDRDWGEISAARPEPSRAGLVYRQVRYEERMASLYAAADLAVCRAGATTVAELAAVGLGSVLIPLPGAPGDHQTANARALTAAGAARLVPDAELTGVRLVAELEPLVTDASRLRRMSDSAHRLARPDAASAVARLAEKHARA
jgi:undecaprenyldiphospho-muramoylpentapeptide beta-N-acetylglucosaminyltransferase